MVQENNILYILVYNHSCTQKETNIDQFLSDIGPIGSYKIKKDSISFYKNILNNVYLVSSRSREIETTHGIPIE